MLGEFVNTRVQTRDFRLCFHLLQRGPHFTGLSNSGVALLADLRDLLPQRLELGLKLFRFGPFQSGIDFKGVLPE